MNLATLDIAILAIYAVGIFVLAQWVSREKGTHEKNAQDYFLASRALPWWAAMDTGPRRTSGRGPTRCTASTVSSP